MAKDETTTADGSKATIVTQEGYDRLVEELNNLKNNRRREVAEHLKEAISYGDISENSEYEEAKNEQAFVEGRIIELEEKVKNAKIIKDDKKGKSVSIVQLGSTVVLSQVGEKEESTYTIVGSTEADPFKGKISNESPLGQALLEKKVGETVTFDAPRGQLSYKILKLV